MAKTLASICGAILVLFGLAGFISNPLVGPNALFAVGAAFGNLHLIFGAILLIVAFWASENARVWLKLIGAALFFFGLAGVLMAPASGGLVLGFAFANGAADWFNLVAGVVLFIAGMYGRGSHSPQPPIGPNTL